MLGVITDIFSIFILWFSRHKIVVAKQFSTVIVCLIREVGEYGGRREEGIMERYYRREEEGFFKLRCLATAVFFFENLCF